MDAPRWDDRLRIGIADIDYEHGLQAGLINALDDAIRGGRAAQAGSGILAQLLDYTEAHFLAEEMLMRLRGTSGYEAHVGEHDRLVTQLNDLKTRAQSGQEPVTAATVALLKEWLSIHIRQMDSHLT